MRTFRKKITRFISLSFLSYAGVTLLAFFSGGKLGNESNSGATEDLSKKKGGDLGYVVPRVYADTPHGTADGDGGGGPDSPDSPSPCPDSDGGSDCPSGAGGDAN